ncbi:MAG: serine hydrolase domain-containing protein, partial [Planctomycetota bacterium]
MKTATRIGAAAVLSLVGIGLAACSSSNPPMFPADADLGQKIELTRQHLALPGAVVAVYEGDEPIIRDAFGVASLETKEPMTLGHHFRVASITKPVVATVLLQLADEGQVSLDDAVSQYVEGVPGGDAITLRELAQHTSGLRNYIAISEVKEAFANEPERSWTETELLSFAYDEGPYFKPTEDGWMYSNTNYILLGQIIEQVESKPLAAVIDERICQPLGLANTAYSVESSLPKPFAKGYQYGDADGPNFWVGEGTVAWDVTDTSPSMWHAAGAMYSTLDDTRVLMDAITRGELVSDEAFAEQTTWRDAGYPVDYWYGLGLVKYFDTIGHNGNLPGYQVTAVRAPERDLTVV